MKQLDLFLSDDKAEKEKPKERTIDTHLGPKSPVMGYKKYLESPEWRDKRRYAIYKAGHRCHDCGKSGGWLQVHHKHYETLYHERLEDVLVLCPSCHPSADAERECDTGLETWACKKYGEHWEAIGIDYIQDQYNAWLERKELEDDYY